NGYANTYYSAAALAASQSWSAWFFGSFDAGNFITVDKPPLSTMLMGLSVRLFGLSSLSILLPEALAGVATVVVLFQTVRRSFGPVAAAIAGLVMALTPVAVLMFRFNNPDALLTLVLVCAAAAVVRGLESGSIRWALVASVLIGIGFLTKYLQAYLVLPAFALVWLVEAPGSLRRRIAGLFAAALAVIAASGWWVLIVDAMPEALRPYIGGSTDNSALDLILGYDGLSRIFGFLGRRGGGIGTDGGGPVGGAGGAGFGGTPGVLRLFNSEFVGQISWLIPFALIALAVGLLLHARAKRGDAARAGYLLWGSWFVVTAGVFSFMSGIIHPYYTVALAPAIAALVGAGTVDLWRLRSRSVLGGIGLAGAIVVTAAWGAHLLATTPTFAAGLGPAALVAAGIAAAVLILPAKLSLGPLPLMAATLGVAAVLAGPAAYALDTVGSANTGAIPSAGPTVSAGGGRGGAFGPDGGGGPQFGGGPGQTTTASAALVDYLVANKGDATWIVAVSGSQEAGSLELASGEPVMAMGGFSGSDPAPTLAQLQEYVRSGKLRYVLLGGGGRGGGPGGGGSSTVASWVAANGTVVSIGGSSGTLYDLGAK
nr:glycosyltransferase family 39 protein [Chloroflexota bacterium]